MVHGRGSGFVLAAAIGLIALAPAQAAAAGVRVPAASGGDTVTGTARVGTAAVQGTTGTRRRTLPVVQRSTATATARPATVRRLSLPAGVGTNVRVSPNTGGLFSETAVAIDPNDTSGTHLTAASNSPGASGMPAYSSADGGATWSTSTLQGRGLPFDASMFDPGVAYDLNGTLSGNPWFSFIGVDNSFQTELTVEHRDLNGNLMVSVPDTPINGPDKPMIAVDPRSGNGSVYVGYTQNPSNINHQPLAAVASHNLGVTFNAPVQVWDSGGDIGAWPAVGIDGTVYMVWDDYCGLNPGTVDTATACAKPNGQILFSKSTDGGASWSATPTRITDTTSGFGSILPNHAPECTAGCPARPVNASPQIAIDRSGGARNGTIYVVYGDGSDPQFVASTVPSAHRMHVFLQESKDGGATWSSRVQLDAGNPNDAWQPSVAVDQSNGNVVAAWYDRRDDASNHLYLPYFRESTADSGGVAQFDMARRLADAQSDPAIDCGATGDYLQIAAAAGVAHPVWTDTRTGLPAIFTAAVTESVTPVPTPSPTPPVSSPVRPAVGSSWLQLPGGGSDIGVGASCQAWIIGLNGVGGGGETWFFDGSGWSPFIGGGVRITVHPSGFPRLVNNVGGIYRLQPTGWQQLPGAGTDIASGPDTSLWVIGVDNIGGGHGVYFFNNGAFSFANGGGVRIAVGPDGLPWIVNNLGAIWHLTGNGWVNVPGGGNDIGVGADGSVWLLGLNQVGGGFQTYRYNGTGWDAVSGGGVAISVGPDGLPWVINSSGQIFERV